MKNGKKLTRTAILVDKRKKIWPGRPFWSNNGKKLNRTATLVKKRKKIEQNGHSGQKTENGTETGRNGNGTETLMERERWKNAGTTVYNKICYSENVVKLFLCAYLITSTIKLHNSPTSRFEVFWKISTHTWSKNINYQSWNNTKSLLKLV